MSAHLTAARGLRVLQDPLLNKGTAFTRAERAELDLDGLLPPVVETLNDPAYVGLRHARVRGQAWASAR